MMSLNGVATSNRLFLLHARTAMRSSQGAAGSRGQGSLLLSDTLLFVGTDKTGKQKRRGQPRLPAPFPLSTQVFHMLSQNQHLSSGSLRDIQTGLQSISREDGSVLSPTGTDTISEGLLTVAPPRSKAQDTVCSDTKQLERPSHSQTLRWEQLRPPPARSSRLSLCWGARPRALQIPQPRAELTAQGWAKVQGARVCTLGYGQREEASQDEDRRTKLCFSFFGGGGGMGVVICLHLLAS